ncbi:MAG: SU10 major capsid protein, partial [Planctomycetota bacterium]
INDIVYVQRTGETMRVTSKSSNDITVTRDWGATASVALVDNDQLSILGNMSAESATASTAVSTKLTTLNNYTQTFRDPFSVSRRLLKSETYGGNVLAYLHRARMIEHAKDIELSFLYGEKNAAGTDPTSTGGLNEFISTNSTSFGGAIGSLEEVFSAAEGDFRYGSSKKVMFAGFPVVSNISLLAEQSLRTVPAPKTFGIDVRSLVTPFGEYMIVPHKLLEGDTWKKDALIADLSNLGYRYLKDSDTQLRTNIQDPSADGRKDEILSDVGLFRVLEETHAKWTGAAS